MNATEGTRRPILRLWIVAVLFLALAACSSSGSDVEQQDALLDKYIAAVQAGDETALQALAAPGTDAAEASRQKIAAIGDRAWSSVDIAWRRGEFPTVAIARVTAIDDQRQPIDDTVQLTRQDDTWYVVLGPAPLGPNDPTPASTDRSS